MESLKNHLQSSRNIGLLSIIIFVAVAVSMVFSTYYMNTSITAEENAQNRRMQYRQQGENLADASDYLTAEVRYYAITGQIQHFYNYWYEIHETKQREEAIQDFESSNPPQEEKELLEEAKRYSDLLVETETYSMKMILTVMGVSEDLYPENEKLSSYIKDVLTYQWPADTKDLSEDEMRQKAIDILYDADYENYKTQIMTPIEEFQTVMNDRLDQEVEEKKNNTRAATVIQVILAFISIGAIGFLLSLMNNLYIRPLKNYTREIKRSENLSQGDYTDEDGALEILDAKIVPYGARELVHFADSFNRLIDRFFQELCQRKNAQENMRKARNEAELANQAKSVFLAQMSHELRTPLNAIDGYTDLLDGTPLKNEQKKYVQNIRYSSNGLLELINQILDFSKIESGHLEMEEIDFDMREILKEVRGVMENQAKQKGLYLYMEMDERIPEVLIGDPLRIRQLLLNLIGNAVKFTAKGGVIVRLRLEEQEEIEFAGEVLKEPRCCIRFDVIDTGIGVKKEVKRKIFQPFMQSDSSVTRKYGGTGLGLPICSQIVMLSGDKNHRLHLESVEGRGSDFYFRMDFPISESAKVQEKDPEEISGRIPNFEGRRILVVDDNIINIQVETAMLQVCHVDVTSAEGGEEAVQILSNDPGIEMILMDIRMPKMDGYETARKIRKIPGYEKTPILALTADAMAEVRRKAKQAGMNGCILKPVKQAKLFEKIGQYLKETEAHISEKMREDVQMPASPIVAGYTQEEEEGLLYFDENHLLLQLGGNRQAMTAIVESFLQRHKEDGHLLQDCLGKQEQKKAEDLIHTLKGLAGNMSCRPLYESCMRLLKELRSQQPPLNKDHIKEYGNFCQIHTKTVEYLQRTMDEWKQKSETETMEQMQRQRDPSESQENPNQDPAQNSNPEDGAFDIVEQIKELCENCEAEAAVVIEMNMTELSRRLGADRAGRMRQHSLNYDFEGVLECLAVREG
ncbi:MAG: response regulator [Clostridia bacterium]|nr:response regulator [Clostridia bacterium]